MRQREPLLDEPAEDEIEVHEALLNWAEWCRVRRRPWRCLSVEGRYRPAAGNVYEPQSTRPPPKASDPLAAEEVNGALLAVPEQHRQALHWRYHLRAPDRVIARALAIRPGGYGRFMRDARLMLRNVLLFRRSRAIIRPTIRPPSSDETDAPGRGVVFAAAA